MQHQKIFIYGAPGVGKTTLSRELHQKLKLPLVEGDYLREVVAQKEKTEQEDPFVYVGTKEAYRKFGELNEENVIKGLHAVRNSMEPYIEKEINSRNKLILEAAFINPNKVETYGKAILVITPDEKKHENQFFQHREKNELNEEGFIAVRLIQSFLMNEAERLNVQIIENNGKIMSDEYIR